MQALEALGHRQAVWVGVLVMVVAAATRLGWRGAHHANLAARIEPAGRHRGAVVPGCSVRHRANDPIGLSHWPGWRPKATVPVASAVLVFLLAWVLSASVTWGAAAAATAVVTTVAAMMAAARRSDARVERALPGVVEELARSLRSGASFHQALVDVAHLTPGSVGTDLLSVTSRATLGEGLDHALHDWGAEHRLASVRLFHGAMILTMRSGADGARALDGLAQSMRDKATVEQETQALVAQAQLSGLVIASLPVVFLGFSFLVDRGGASFLLDTAVGRLCLFVALGLDGAGYVWMRRLAHSVDV